MGKITLVNHSSSFRDPSGYVVRGDDGAIYRTISRGAKASFRVVCETGLLGELIKEGLLIDHRECDLNEFSKVDPSVECVLSHPKIPFISYPYEWTFEQLRAAAALHLELQIRSLATGVSLVDATAYNVQFVGAKPIFIDTLSFVPYVEGEMWKGQKQFTEQFLAPLLFWSYLGIPFNDWYRGTLSGISIEDICSVLPWNKKISLRYFLHFFLPNYFSGRAKLSLDSLKGQQLRKMPKEGLQFILRQLLNWVVGLSAPKQLTVWQNYTAFRSYSQRELELKLNSVCSAIAKCRPGFAVDIGCNSGEFSVAALSSGAGYVVGLEVDHGAHASAFERSRSGNHKFLPLHINICNPSCNAGWDEAERLGLRERMSAEFLLGLAVIHHIVIGNNVPLASAVSYLVGLAPQGIIEWVPKSDPMVKLMLQQREDIFPNFEFNQFTSEIERCAKIEEVIAVSDSGRQLVRFSR